MDDVLLGALHLQVIEDIPFYWPIQSQGDFCLHNGKGVGLKCCYHALASPSRYRLYFSECFCLISLWLLLESHVQVGWMGRACVLPRVIAAKVCLLLLAVACLCECLLLKSDSVAWGLQYADSVRSGLHSPPQSRGGREFQEV